MINTLPSGMTMIEFLEWWNNHPLIFGGDKYSSTPGMALYLMQDTDFERFSIRVEPLQPDKPEVTVSLLSTFFDVGPETTTVNIDIKDDVQFVAQIELSIREDRCQAWGEGEWLSLDTKPSSWSFNYRLH